MDLVALHRPWKRGEVMEVLSQRTLRDSFKDTHEYVSFYVEASTDEVVFDVTWPLDAPPQKLDLTRNGGNRGDRSIPLDRLDKTADGRRRLIERIQDPEIGEKISLFWEWEPRESASTPTETAPTTKKEGEHVA